jgi:hypothetical protein
VVLPLKVADGPEIVKQAKEGEYDLIILPLSPESPADPVGALDDRSRYIVRHAHCRVLLAAPPVIPTEVLDTTPSAV